MIEVVLESTTATETLEIVRSLRERLILGKEFKYKFIQGGYDWERHEEISHQTVFSFTNSADATWFTLTYL
jgi:hypothetical protein